MFGVLPIGPFRRYQLESGKQMPWYIIPFDRDGQSAADATRASLIKDAAKNAYSDVYVFSHGWNNDWAAVQQRYSEFLDGYTQLRSRYRLTVPPDYRPLLIGIFWPSTSLVTEDEEPLFAGQAQTEGRLQANEELETAIEADRRVRFRGLMAQPDLSRADALELAAIVEPVLGSTEMDLPDTAPATIEEWVDGWPAAETELDLDFILPAPQPGGALQAAAFNGAKKFLPRDILRLFTVQQMKDRAGVIGARGVAPLLAEVFSHGAPRLHMIGHSYGARLLLAALCYPDDPKVTASSLLLLQPAVSHLCFAGHVEKTKSPGGYRKALERVRAPILSTFSKHDFPLRRAFHAAARRKRDLAEVEIAADDPPSIFAALGGYGPRASGETILPILDPMERYPLNSGARLLGIDGSRTIGGHGKINNESTWWALHNLVEWNWSCDGETNP
jgi:hypothetical protein